MSLDKLIAAATDYFTTGADAHRASLAATADLQKAHADYEKRVAAKATKPQAVTKPTVLAESTAEENAAIKAAAKAKAVDDISAVEAEAIAVSEAAAKAKAAAEAAAMVDDIPDFKIDAISYEEDIRPLLRAKSLANRDALVALLGKFGVKSGQELTADQYPAFLAGLKAL